MTEEKLGEEQPATPAGDSPEKKETIEQDPLKQELEKVTSKKKGKTELEQALYTEKQLQARIKVLKEEAGEIELVPEDDDAPVTRRELREIEAQRASKTALQLADSIENETERELTKYHLQNSIKSTGNPQEDMTLALALVNAAKNKQILEEANRKGASKVLPSGSGQPKKEAPEEIEFTHHEIAIMTQFKLTKEQVLEARRLSKK